MTRNIIIIIGLTLLSSVKSEAQIAVYGGANYCTIRNDINLKNIKPILASNLGLSIQYHPFKGIEKLSLINEVCFSRKGYDQDLGAVYSFRFNYIAFPVLLDYRPAKLFSVQAGIELSSLLSTSIRQGTKTYNNFDTGLVLGLNFNKGQILSFYVRGVYGLLPMLDYYAIDELGNFTGRIHDLKNICFSVGIKINLFNEKFWRYS